MGITHSFDDKLATHLDKHQDKSRLSIQPHVYDISILGDCQVGKTSIYNKLFNSSNKPVSYQSPNPNSYDMHVHRKQIENTNIMIYLWDIRNLNPRMKQKLSWHCNSIQAVIIVYDISNRLSFENLSSWVQYTSTCKNSSHINVIILGHKVDLVSDYKRRVSTKEGRDFATKYGFMFMETSININNGDSVNDAFNMLVTHIYHRIKTN